MKRACKRIFARGTNRLLIALLTIALALTACAPGEQTPPEPECTFDDLGRLVCLNETPERIISVAPSMTEILFALGLGNKVVGRTDYCNYPEEVLEIESIGGFTTPDEEKILALDPDLVLIAHGTPIEVIDSLDAMGLTVFCLHTTGLDDLLNDIQTVGEVTDSETEAETLTSELAARIEAVTSETEGLELEEILRVFYFIWNDPIFSVGSGTFEDGLIEAAGGVNICHNSTGYPIISVEEVVARNPEVIIAPSGHGEGADFLYDWAMNSTALNTTDARQNGRVYKVDQDLVQRPGPRLVDGLEWFAYFIHPEIFDEPEE
jgi:iron complex transport system substrate-binding protein